VSLYLVCVCGFPCCAAGSFPGLYGRVKGWTFRCVSDTHFLPPFITQSAHYKTKYNLRSRTLNPILLKSYTIVMHIKQTLWNATDTLLDCGTQIIRPRNSVGEKVVSLSAEDYEPALLLCVPEDVAHHVMAIEFKTRCCDQPCHSLGGL
jgi:hypothetical protein